MINKYIHYICVNIIIYDIYIYIRIYDYELFQSPSVSPLINILPLKIACNMTDLDKRVNRPKHLKQKT